MSSENETLTEVSKLAQNLQKVKDSTLKVINTRERLPQPLFWSLLFTELEEIKKKKAKERLLKRIVEGIGVE